MQGITWHYRPKDNVFPAVLLSGSEVAGQLPDEIPLDVSRIQYHHKEVNR